MLLKNCLKDLGIWAEFYQTLAKNDRQDCQNCIPGVERKVFETLSCEKSLLLLVWILLEKIAKFPQINVKKQKKHSTTKNKFVFQKKHNFQTILSCEPVLLDFWPTKFREHSRNCIIFPVPKSNWREKVGFEKFFWFYFGFLSKTESD